MYQTSLKLKVTLLGICTIMMLLSQVRATDIRATKTTPAKPDSQRDELAPEPKNPVLAEVEDKPGLPRVLIIGDSISMGYTLPVRKLLEGKANVHRPGENCGPTTRGIENLDKWLGDKKWDVIHFNFGLHDLKYIDEKGRMVSVAKGKQNVPPEQYEKNLREIVARLKKTGAKLIWRRTTPVPNGTTGREAGSEVKYNEVADKVMRENEIPIHDLNKMIAESPMYQKPRNVHFTTDGSNAVAADVVQQIDAALKAK